LNGASETTQSSGRLQTGRAGNGLAICLMLINITNSIAMALIPIVNNELRDSFGLSAGKIGLLTAVCMLAFGLASIPAGVAAARWGGPTVLAGVLIFVAGSVIFALSSSYAGFLIGRLLQGAAGATIIPVANQLFHHHLGEKGQAKALGIFGSAHGVGVISALLILPSVQNAGGHRAVFLLTAGVSAALGLIALSQRPIRSRPADSDTQVTIVRTLREVAAVAVNRRMLLLAVVNIGVTAVIVGILTWTPPFLHDQRGTGTDVAAYLTAGVGVASLLGNIAGAAAMARWGKPFVLLSSLLLMMVFTGLAPVVPGAGLAVAFIVASAFLTLVMFPAILGSVPDIVSDSRQVGAASGFLNLSNLVGSFLSPWVFGLLLSQYGSTPGHKGYLAGYLWLALFPFLGSIAGAFYMRSRRRA
jgi:predicted MFS family arabinose efflux permease